MEFVVGSRAVSLEAHGVAVVHDFGESGVEEESVERRRQGHDGCGIRLVVEREAVGVSVEGHLLCGVVEARVDDERRLDVEVDA